MDIKRAFYASAGQADIIASHRFWKRGEYNPTQVSLTFSGQVEDFFQARAIRAYMVSDCPDGQKLIDGAITLEHRLKASGAGMGYYLAEWRYCRSLVATARRFRADVALIDSGVMPLFMAVLFRIAGIRVVPILHNCLWPSGFRPKGKMQRVLQLFDGWFLRWVPECIVAVSPEAERQIDELAGPRHRPVHQTRAQFRREYFADIPLPDPQGAPLEVMFVGRVTESKGALDIPDMAARVERQAPGAVRWTICGGGAALAALRAKITAMELDHVVDARGWTSPADLKELHAKSHVSIVPTRGSFAEGLAMTAVEAILAGRPLVSNPIVPALELLAPAAMAALSNDADSHADAVLALARDRRLYARLQANTRDLGEQFYDRQQGLAAVLMRALGGESPQPVAELRQNRTSDELLSTPPGPNIAVAHTSVNSLEPTAMSSPTQGTLLLVLPVQLYALDGRLWLDTQACNGLRLWLANFARVIVCAPVLSVAKPPPMTSEIRELLPTKKLQIQELPAAWTPADFFRKLPATIRLLNRLIADADYLQFAIGGFWGDWAAIAAILAYRQRRPVAIWTDRVESKVMVFHAQQHSGGRRLYRRINAALAWRLEKYVIRRSALGLFHGMDTFHTYSGLSREPHLVHDIHLGLDARIAPDELAGKISRAADRPIRIVYGGRVHPDKGVKDWINTLSLLAKSRTPFDATWFGDGPELPVARALVAELGLQGFVDFPGAVENHDLLMQAFRNADIFMFCHKTPESPRCLIEALLSGTPIVGYDSLYARDLIHHHGGGILTEANPAALAAQVSRIAGQRSVLRDLTKAAALDGHPLIDEEVFRHRSELIKTLA